MTVEKIREYKEFVNTMNELVNLYFNEILDNDFRDLVGWRLSEYDDDMIIVEYEELRPLGKCRREWYTSIEELNMVIKED
jgi:hypothetical protein